MTTKILIADDHNLLSEAIASMLRLEGDYETRTTDSFQGVLDNLAEHDDFALILLDLKMPGMVGLESVRTIVKKAGDTKVVLFTGMVDQHMLRSTLALGARGLIPKTMPLQSLNSVIQVILSGQIFVPMEMAQNGIQSNGTGQELSNRELFVLRRAADGLTNKEIARDMDATEETVKMHMRSICKKLGARNRAHAAMISREQTLI